MGSDAGHDEMTGDRSVARLAALEREAPGGVEPPLGALHAPALPLGHGALAAGGPQSACHRARRRAGRPPASIARMPDATPLCHQAESGIGTTMRSTPPAPRR
jgi:hypothetical protein